MRSLLLIGCLLILTVTCQFVTLTPTSCQAQSAQADERIAQAKMLEGILPDAYNAAMATLPHKENPNVSLTVATKRVDSATAVLAVSINTNDPRVLADIPALDFTFQPVELVAGTVAQTIGIPMKVSVGKPTGASLITGPTIRTISSVIPAPEVANALSISTSLNGRGFRYIISTKDQVNSGTVTISNYPPGPTVQASGTQVRSRRGSLRSHFSAVDDDGDCVQATVTCGGCSRSANCKVGGIHNEITFICDCSSGPCSCGIICDGGCPPLIN
jgi:hypothetical protein